MPAPHDVNETAEELYEDAPCGYVSHRLRDGLILRVNRTLAEWLGQGQPALVGQRRFHDLLSPPARLLYGTRHEMTLRATGLAGGLALEMLRVDGTRMPVLVTSRLKRDATGEASWVLTSVVDAGAHHRYEEDLRAARDAAEQAAAEARFAQAAAARANEAKTRFLAAMNHEFRTPINAISGFAELLDSSGQTIGEATRRLYLSEMRMAAQHLVGLLEDATRYARLDALQRAPGLRPMRLKELARSGLGLVAEELDRRGVGTSLLDGPDDPMAMAHGLAAEAVGCVLRDIARRAAPRTALRASLRTEGERAAIVISGSAMPSSAEALQGLLSPLDAPEVLQRGLEGSGLGIAFAQRVLRLCGGSLDLGTSAQAELAVCVGFVAAPGPSAPALDG